MLGRGTDKCEEGMDKCKERYQGGGMGGREWA